jgi:hypothetical protein
MPIRRNGATHVAGYVVHFKDGAGPEECLIGQGSREEMEALYRMMPAVSYSGDRPVERAEFVIVPWEEIKL